MCVRVLARVRACVRACVCMCPDLLVVGAWKPVVSINMVVLYGVAMFADRTGVSPSGPWLAVLFHYHQVSSWSMVSRALPLPSGFLLVHGQPRSSITIRFPSGPWLAALFHYHQVSFWSMVSRETFWSMVSRDLPLSSGFLLVHG